ncbi:afadin- and alpha-actinin-binding protein A-like isoform 2-T2 [Synchiropus picturatus]
MSVSRQRREVVCKDSCIWNTWFSFPAPKLEAATMPEFPPDFKDVSCSSVECRSFPLRRLGQSSPHGNLELGSFCTELNVQECLSHISQEMTSLGLDSPWKETNTSSTGLDVVAVLNTMYDLVQLNRRSLQTLGSLEVEHVKTSSNAEFLQHTTTRLKEQIEVCKRENAGLLERERRLQAKVKSLQNAFKDEKEEVHKLQNIISSRAIQYNHEMKRKEHELNKLRERLTQLLADKREKKQSLEISCSIGRANGKRGLWKTEKTEAKHEEEMYKTLLTDYDHRQRELMLENAELRKVLQQMKKDMVLLMSSKRVSSKEDASDDGLKQAGLEEDDKIDSNKENMELLCSREKLTNSIRLQWRRLKSHVERLDSQVSLVQEDDTKASEAATQESSQELGRLNLEVQQCKDLIQAQQKLLQQQLGSPCDEESSSLASDCHMKKEKDHLREEWRSLTEQRKGFEMERKRLTEAAIRLSHERKTFEEDRALWLKQQFLNLSPFGEPCSDPRVSNSNSALQSSHSTLSTVFSMDELLTSKYKALRSSSLSDLHCTSLAEDSAVELKKASRHPEELWDFGGEKEPWCNSKDNWSNAKTPQSNCAKKQ